MGGSPEANVVSTRHDVFCYTFCFGRTALLLTVLNVPQDCFETPYLYGFAQALYYLRANFLHRVFTLAR